MLGLDFTYPSLAVRALLAGGGAAPVTPLTDWRIQPSAVTCANTTDNSGNQTAILASKANKDMPTLSVAGNTTGTVTLDLPEILAPGGVVFITTTNGSPANRVISMDQSTDGGSNWSSVSFTPMQTQSSDNTDQLIDLPAASARKYRLSYQVTNASAQFFAFKVVQLDANPLKNDLTAIVGMSITNSNTQGGLVIYDAIVRNSGRDPIFVNVARSGAKPADMLTEQLVKLIQPRTYIGRCVIDVGPNDYLGSGKWQDLSGGSQTTFIGHVQALDDWFTTNSRTPLYLGQTFIDPLNFDAGGATGILQEDVVDGPSVSITNQANGVRPWLMNAYFPIAKLRTGVKNTTLDAYAFDGYGPSLLSWDAWKQLIAGMTAGDGVHPTVYGYMYRYAILDAWDYTFGVTRPHYVERKIAAAEPFCSAPQKNRLYLGPASLPDTADAGAIAARAALTARIDAIGTSYVEKAGQSAPTSLTGMIASYDFDDMDTLWSDNSAAVPAKDQELIRYVSDKTANAYQLINTAAATSGQTIRNPSVYMGEAVGEKAITFNGVQYLDAADSGLYSALNGAGQDFMIGFLARPSAKSSASLRILMQILGTGGLILRYASNSSAIQVVATSSLGTESSEASLYEWHDYVVTAGSGRLKILRDNVQTLDVAWSKPAWTATGFRLGGTTGFAGRMKSLHIANAWDATSRDALRARLHAQKS